jgi:hypothetical protein
MANRLLNAPSLARASNARTAPPYTDAICQPEDSPMRIFMFRSDAQRELQAFTDEPSGNKLPSKFSPWSATGVIRADSNPPHNFSRAIIETAINEHGFQLWRLKPPLKASVVA